MLNQDEIEKIGSLLNQAKDVYQKLEVMSNQSDVSENNLSIGDHLVSPRSLYEHHGLYVGNRNVIHYSGFANGFSSGSIAIVSISDFANGNDVFVKSHPNRKYDGDTSAERAYQRLDEDWYNVLINNCEHFVTWCIEGLHSSPQVNEAVIAIAKGYIAFKEQTEKAKQIEMAYDATKLVAKQIAQQEIASQAVQTIAPNVAKSVLSNSVGVASGVAAGMGIAGAGIGTTTGAVVLGLTAGAPALLIGVGIAGAVGVGLSAKKAFEKWFS